MPITGLFFLPVAPNTPSPSSTIISYISRKYPAQALPPFFLDHRLLADTSSLLPGSPPSQRRYTQFLTLSHHPGITYLATSSPISSSSPSNTSAGASVASTTPMTLVTIPSGQPAEIFFDLVMRKMQPLWSPRLSIRVDNGAALSLQPPRSNTRSDGGSGDSWRMRIGDVRISSRQGQGNLRGVVVEVEYDDGDGPTQESEHDLDEEGKDEEGSDPDPDSQETMLKSFFHAVTKGSGVSLEGLRMVGSVAGSEIDDPPSYTLARQYLEILRFARGP